MLTRHRRRSDSAPTYYWPESSEPVDETTTAYPAQPVEVVHMTRPQVNAVIREARRRRYQRRAHMAGLTVLRALPGGRRQAISYDRAGRPTVAPRGILKSPIGTARRASRRSSRPRFRRARRRTSGRSSDDGPGEPARTPGYRVRPDRLGELDPQAVQTRAGLTARSIEVPS